MAHPTNTGGARAKGDALPAPFNREFRLLSDFIADGGDPQITELEQCLEEAEAELKAARGRADGAEAQRDAALKESHELRVAAAEANRREVFLNGTIAGLRHEVGTLQVQRDQLAEALARVVALVMDGAGDPLSGALDALEAAGIELPALPAAARRLAVAA